MREAAAAIKERLDRAASLDDVGLTPRRMTDVFSYDDLAIQRGLRMVYHHREIDRGLFEKYRRRVPPLLQRGEPVSLGGGRGSHSGAAGL